MISTTPTYDTIVIGTGGIGSATLRELARRGQRVLGIDRFPPGHDRGSSHGATRLIRVAYMEHPDYVPLALRSLERWREFQELRETTLFERTGLIEIGPPEGAVIRGVLESSREHDLHVEELSAHDAEDRFPGLRIPSSMTAVVEPGAGHPPRRGVRASVHRASVDRGRHARHG